MTFCAFSFSLRKPKNFTLRLTKWSIWAAVMFSFRSRRGKMPQFLRSSGIITIPFLISCCVFHLLKVSPMNSIVPPHLRRPKMDSISSVRPAPMRPATPRISPLCTSKLMSAKLSDSSPVTRSATSGSGSPRLKEEPSSEWPTMCSSISCLVTSVTGASQTFSELRSTTTLSQTANTSSRKCVMKIMPMRCFFSVRITSNSRSRSGAVRDAVGSSRIRRLAPR